MKKLILLFSLLSTNINADVPLEDFNFPEDHVIDNTAEELLDTSQWIYDNDSKSLKLCFNFGGELNDTNGELYYNLNLKCTNVPNTYIIIRRIKLKLDI